MSFATALKTVRELRGMSQSDLAAAIGTSPAAINHFEAGRREPAIDNLRKLTRVLNVSVSTLLETDTAHPTACPSCHGKGIIWTRQTNKITLRDQT